MQNHTVLVAKSDGGDALNFAPIFNVAIPFIDRHLQEGRADKVAIRTNQGVVVTYAGLVENVNRCGNALLGLGINPGERVIMIVKDCAEFFYGFWGAIKAGLIPVPVNTLLRAKDYAYIIGDSGCAAVIYSPEFAGEVEAALDQLEQRPSHCLRVEGEGDSLQR